MKKFDENFMWSISADALRHFSEESLIHKIQESPEEVQKLKSILEMVFKQAHNMIGNECYIVYRDEITLNIVSYLRIKGMDVSFHSGETLIKW